MEHESACESDLPTLRTLLQTPAGLVHDQPSLAHCYCSAQVWPELGFTNPVVAHGPNPAKFDEVSAQNRSIASDEKPNTASRAPNSHRQQCVDQVPANVIWLACSPPALSTSVGSHRPYLSP
eukprot:3108012-Rhodomonas_salina.2